MLARIVDSFRTAVRGITAVLRGMLPPKVPAPSLLRGLVEDLTRSRNELIAENAFLRQQLIVAARSVKRPRLRPQERALLALLTRAVRRWRSAMLIVKPETILRWHRTGFRLFWRANSRPTTREPHVSRNVATLIQQMAQENRLWGAERIRGELLKVGIRVSKRTVQRYMLKLQPPTPRQGQRWRTFIRNHSVWACDFLQTYDIWFRPIFAFFIVDVNAKRVVHIAVTRAPRQVWTAQQLRNATAFGDAPLPKFIIRDNDNKFGRDFDRAAQGAGLQVLRTAIQAPLMNACCERFLGSVRRECLDHVIVLGELHLERVLREYCAFFDTARPHQGLKQSIPVATPRPIAPVRRVRAFPVLGGLHHDYRAAA